MTVLYNLDAVPSLADVRAPQATLTRTPDGTSTGLYAALRDAYAERVRRYHDELARALRVKADSKAGPGRPALGDAEASMRPEDLSSSFPAVTLRLDGQELDVNLDDDLYTTLFDLYVFYGPAGVAEMAAALQREATKGPDVTLAPARRFLTFTRNMLSLVIRETLIQIEALAAERLDKRLADASHTISTALDGDLKYEFDPGIWWRTVRPGAVVQAEGRYVLKDRDRASFIDSTLRDAIQARDLLRVAVGSGDCNEVARAGASFSTAQQQVQKSNPLALIILPGLYEVPVTPSPHPESHYPGLSQQTVEDTLVRTLIDLRSQIDEMAKATTSTRSRIRADLSGLREGADADVAVAIIENLYWEGPRGLQRDFMEKARSRIGKDPGYAAMLHAGTLLDLLVTQVIVPGTFEHCVLHHWLIVLRELNEEIATRQQVRQRQFKALSIAAACLSLLAFAAPPLAPAALLIDLSLLAFTYYNVAEQLTALEAALQLQLPDLGAADAASLVAVGEALIELGAYRQTVPIQVASQLVLLSVTQIRAFARLMQAYGYFDDVLTLYRASVGG